MALAAGERGTIEILVNNAGIAGPTAPLLDIEPEDWNETLAVNLTGVFLSCKAALPYLHARDVAARSSTSDRSPASSR